MKKKLVTQKEFARMVGIKSDAYIGRLIKDGIIKLEKGKIDPDDAMKRLEDYAMLPPKAVGKKAKDKPEPGTYAEAKRIKEFYLAALTKLQYEEKAGIMINAKEAEDEIFKQVRQLREAIMNIPVRIVPAIMKYCKKSTKQADLEIIIEKEISLCLKEFGEKGRIQRKAASSNP